MQSQKLEVVRAVHSCLGKLIPERPVREAIVLPPWGFANISIDLGLSFFTLSTTQIQKLNIRYHLLPETRITSGIHISLPRAFGGARLR